jgi:hypothetical protein
MKAKIEKLNERVWIEFSDLDLTDSILMVQFVNSSTQFIDDMREDKGIGISQFAGQGYIRFNGVRVQNKVTTHIRFESPYNYNKTEYKSSFKERIKILFTGELK